MEALKRLGEILVENGYLTREQVDGALETQRSHPDMPLGQILVDAGLLSRERLQLLLAQHGKRLPIGDMLLGADYVTRDQLDDALRQQARLGGRLGEILISKGFLTQQELCEVLTEQFNLPFLPVRDFAPADELRSVVNPRFAAQHRLVPISRLGNRLTVALSDPTHQEVLRDLQSITGHEVAAVLSPPDDVAAVHRRLYGRDPSEDLPLTARRVPDARPASGTRGRSDRDPNAAKGEREPTLLLDGADLAAPSGLAGAKGDGGAPAGLDWTDPGVEVLEEDPEAAVRSKYTYNNEDSPIVQTLVQAILRRALSSKASDIHLEPTTHGPRLRFRVDGVLRELHLGPFQDPFRGTYRSVVSRLKILSQLDITERRRPQDGSFRMMVRSGDQLSAVDFRVGTLPTRFGEGMVIRVLDQLRAPGSLEDLGLSPEVREAFRALIHRPVGIMLLTGPTGSGKSSTLYAALRTIYQPGVKILTAEDPIEFTHPGISQSEVNSVIGNTFARFLRSFLRQDPDVIMVGEIRDVETAEMALRAAQTGHLLFSTLHTNNATASVQRLLDLEMDPNSVASALVGVMAQRLVRKNCSDCAESYQPESYMLQEWFGGLATALQSSSAVFRRGRGCETCHGTGFSGRASVAELWTPTPQEVLLINKRANSDELRAVALSHMASLGEDALRKALAGVTSLDEAFRIVPYADVEHVRNHRAESIVARLRDGEERTRSVA